MTPQQAQAILCVFGKHRAFEPLYYFTRLTIEVDGEAHVGRWGERTLPLAPGPHDVVIYFKYFGRRCSEATTNVDALEGSTISLRYKTPRLVTYPGRLEADP